ncbi:hypothetical protein CN085_10740 [Sinorhizobium meliloti]|uniref:hypothetical protein n=1 Tax=Rhizobium meliloti TaxID=382 RepID=UPI000FDA78AD|nr:hypothetical protein [Sinorhizobium meliloti]RVP15562.1 hypothetical protein CN085_10740 [Sinorhizobium meliloti]
MSRSKHMDINSIRDRAQSVEDGPVSKQEVEFARQILRSSEGDIGAALFVVGLCGDNRDATLIETYLRSGHKDVHGELALKSLCRYLGLIDCYRPVVRKYILAGGDIDFAGSKAAAIHLAPEYLLNFRDKEVERTLLVIFCDFQNRNRSAARHALVKTLELHGELKDPIGLRTDTDPDASLIIAAACRSFGLERLDFMAGFPN